MEVVITQEKLSQALANTSRVATSKTGLPILGNVLFRTDKNRLLVAATNLEVASTNYIGAKVVKQGSITIPAKIVNDFVHNLPKEQITLSVKNNRLHIKTPNHNSIINGVNDEEFPELPTVDIKDSVTYTLAVDDFKTAVSQTIIAASADPTRQILTGVYWHTNEKSLFLAATDGYRLAEKKLMNVSSELNAIIPTTTLQEVLRSLRDDITEITILIDETQVTFLLEDIEITSRLIDGNFPNYRQLIPSKNETSFSVEKDEFTRVIKVASLFAKGSGGGINLDVNADDGTVSVSSVASEVGENTSTIKATITGSGSVSLNSRYLIDALAVLDGPTISFGFSGKLAPCVVTSGDKPNYTHIIMPLKS
ncbi:MAG TPA: DNA polymerase III subunit beta [Candidatus Saccharibacteria bacterium]|nr:DNA polymerase III subunit beta [Candidatus Saccharibacteria bacterium]